MPRKHYFRPPQGGLSFVTARSKIVVALRQQPCAYCASTLIKRAGTSNA